MKKNPYLKNLYMHFFLLIILISCLYQTINSSQIKNESLLQSYSKSHRKLVTGYDIVKQINEECLESTNILKYNIVFNSTAFLLNLSTSSRRNLFSSIKELDGENLGVENGKTYADLIKTNFPKSYLNYYDSTTSLIMSLLQGKIKGFLIEEPVAEYYTKQMNAITYFKDRLDNDNYGFAFPKNANDKLRTEFDEYLFAIKLDGTYDKVLKIWTGEFNSLKTIDRGLSGNKGTIKVGFNIDVPPFAYKENNEYVGFEIDLLYRFAKLYGYKIELKSLTIQEQMDNIISEEIDIAGGCFSITEQRRLLMQFSSTIYEGGTVVVIEKEEKITTGQNNNGSSKNKVIIRDQQGVQKIGNILNFPVTGLPDGKTRSGACVFPENLTEMYTFECSISGLTEDNPMVNGYTYGLITDYIEVNEITLNSVYSYIPSHILGNNINNDIEHPGTICPKMNLDLAGIDNIVKESNTIKFEFGLYRKYIAIPKTQADLILRKGSSSYRANCQQKKDAIYLSCLNGLVRYVCSCTLTSASNSDSFFVDFNSISFNYENDINKKLNMVIQSKETIKKAMSNLFKNTATFPSNLTNLNTLIVTKLTNGRCLNGRFTFNAIGILYKTISQEQNFESNNPINSNFILKIPYDLEEAESQISINAKVRGVLMIRKDYYENLNNNGEYLYLSSLDNVFIDAIYCEGDYYSDNTYNGSNNTNQTNRTRYNERVETISLRKEMSMPKWLIILLMLVLTFLVMVIIYIYLRNLEGETEYVIKYNKKTSTTSNTNSISNSININNSQLPVK